jgi:hypothetical protein
MNIEEVIKKRKEENIIDIVYRNKLKKYSFVVGIII